MSGRGAGLAGRGSLTLGAVLEVTGGPVGEEEAWALLHQALTALRDRPAGPLCGVRGPSDLLLLSQGKVHPDTYGRGRVGREASVVADIGVAVYDA